MKIINYMKNTYKYFIYARKSSEDKERQIQSIEDQVKILTDFASKEGLEIVNAYSAKVQFSESKSAKAPHKRKEYYKMLDAIKQGKADGILCWKLDRLSRNPSDSGELQWMLQQEVIKSIKTPDREYLPKDNALVLSVETGLANQFILDLKKNTARGVMSKIEKGWYPSFAPAGYKNTIIENQGENYILKDEDKFDLVRKMWDLMLTGAYTVEEIRKIANDEWEFKTRKLKRKGGKPLAKSSLYRIFTSIFYTGMFEYAGEIYKGSHPPMVSFEEFDYVQNLLGRYGRPRPQKHQHAYVGWARCGECGCAITASKKRKTLSTGEIKFYTYYHCTHKKEHITCLQRKYITEEVLELELQSILESITILPQFKKWALEILRRNHKDEVNKNEKVYSGLHKSKSEKKSQLNNLVDLLTRGVINEETYKIKQKEYQNNILELDKQIQSNEVAAYNWLESAEKVFTFVSHASDQFKNGDIRVKKEILQALGSNPLIVDGHVQMKFHPWLEPIVTSYLKIEKEYLALEPDKMPNDQSFSAIYNVWGA